jgi:hypothetical protein
LEFKLTYSGKLLGANSTNSRAAHKHEIRRAFHPQLRRLWMLNDGLKNLTDPLQDSVITINAPPPRNRQESLRERFQRGDYKFVPLVTADLSLICGLEILLLRPDPPGALIRSGDIDNRLKTLFDALRMPADQNELAGATPTREETPFYCLLEDDRLISRVSIQTDLLLESLRTDADIDENDCRLLISVYLRPQDVGFGTMAFWG